MLNEELNTNFSFNIHISHCNLQNFEKKNCARSVRKIFFGEFCTKKTETNLSFRTSFFKTYLTCS